MRFFFSLSKPKKPQIKEDPMSEVQQHLAAIDEIYKKSYFDLSQNLISMAFRIINCPEMSKISAEKGQQLIQFAASDQQNFANQAKSIVAHVQQGN